MTSFDPQIYWEMRLRTNSGLSGVGYIGMGEGYNHWLYKVRQRVFLRAVSRLPVDWAGAKVVDVGSGNGFYIERWKELEVGTVIGTDLTGASIEYLRKRFPNDPFYQVDIGGTLIQPLKNGFYDIVTAFDVLFHIVDDTRYQRAIENIYGLLKPGGWFIFSENFLHERIERRPHQVSRCLGDIMECLRRSNFRVVRRMPMFVLMNDPIDQRSRLIRWGWHSFSTLVRRVNWLGLALGMILYPMELFLTGCLKESPTTEMMICRKPE